MVSYRKYNLLTIVQATIFTKSIEIYKPDLIDPYQMLLNVISDQSLNYLPFNHHLILDISPCRSNGLIQVLGEMWLGAEV